MGKRWRVVPHDAARIEQLVVSAGVSPVLAQLLVSRGVYDGTEARRFLSASLADLRDPFELPGCRAAVAQIAEALRDSRRITIYGDYDCDGMTAAGILVGILELVGAQVNYYVPNRLEDGYGLSLEAVERLARRGTQTIITVDCGITSLECAERCRELGVQLIITDHHQFGARLPAAAAIVHPRLPGGEYPFGDLCGAGVAFKLAWGLCQELSGAKKVSPRMRACLMRALALAAIGTVADMVPLMGENRVLVRHGLRSLQGDPPEGLAQLMRITKLNQKSSLTSEDISFTIAPRLNAAGRLGQAQLGVELLTASDPVRATALAEYIDQLNASRDTLERSVYKSAHQQAKERFDPQHDPALVLAGAGWHLGVIGVVAGRLAERYSKPVIIIASDPLAAKPAVGSGRAGGPIDLHAALHACEEHLISFGGHRAAAGLKVDDRRIDQFRSEFFEAVAVQQAELSEPHDLVIDAETTLGQLSHETLQQIELLAPFGQGNPRPLLLAQGVALCEPSRRMGSGDRHLSMRLEHGGTKIRSVAFGGGEWCEQINQLESRLDIVFRPVVNEYQGRRSIEAQVVDWRPTARETSQSSSPERQSSRS